MCKYKWVLRGEEELGLPHLYSVDLPPYKYSEMSNEDLDMLALAIALQELNGEYDGWAYDEEFDDSFLKEYCLTSCVHYSEVRSSLEGDEVAWNSFMYSLLEQAKKPSLNPNYYTWHPIECKVVTNHFSFNLGCAIKYIWRSGGPVTKGSVLEDLQKAINYLQFEIERIKNEKA